MRIISMILPLVVLISGAILFTSANKKDNLSEILEKSLEASNAIQNGSYTANCEYLTTSGYKTVADSIVVTFEKIAEDTLNGKLKILWPAYSVEYLYDAENIFIANHKDEKLLIVDVSKHSVGHITGNMISGVLFEDYLDPKGVNDFRRNSSDIIELSADTVINKRDCYRVKYFFKEDTVLNITDRIGELYIEKSTYLPLGFFNEYRYNGLHGSDKLMIMDYDFNNEKYQNMYDKNQFPDDYAIEIYEDKPTDIETLQEGDQVDLDFSLNYHRTGEPLSFDKQDKLILLDYWYMACPPCTKAAPYVNEMYQNYQSKGLKVIGINPIDSKGEKLDTFFENKKIDYPICLDSKKITTEIFGVSAYPTFILLDNNGKILHRLDGFDAELMGELESKIEEYL